VAEPGGLAAVLAARQRISPWLPPTPLRRYAALDTAVGHGISVWVKHENVQPTNSFKARNALSAATLLDGEARARGLVAASRGNHGQGLAWAGQVLGARVVVCVPVGNNPDKNAAMRGLGAHVVEEGLDYDAATHVAERFRNEGMTLVHSTNDDGVIAGAGTLTLEILLEQPQLDALVIAVGGGSQCVGAITVARALKPDLKVYAVQAAGAPAIHDSWHAGRPLEHAIAATIADGLATRKTYAHTFPTLKTGLRGFVTVDEAELAHAMRLFLAHTHHLAEPAGAAGLAGLLRLRQELAGQRVGIVLSGGNIALDTLRTILNTAPS